MKNIFFASLMIGFICVLPSCKKPCSQTYFFPIGNQLKKYSFEPGSYWIYQDSASGTIDSQSVYAYSAQNHVPVGNDWYDGGCTVFGDAFSMSVASFWNGMIHDSIFWGNNNGYSAGEVVVSYSTNLQPQCYYEYYAIGLYTDTLTKTLNNFTVSGRTFPKVYLSVSDVNNHALMYHIDNIGVVKWVFNDTINGQRTWNLLRYHVINP